MMLWVVASAGARGTTQEPTATPEDVSRRATPARDDPGQSEVRSLLYDGGQITVRWALTRFDECTALVVRAWHYEGAGSG